MEKTKKEAEVSNGRLGQRKIVRGKKKDQNNTGTAHRARAIPLLRRDFKVGGQEERKAVPTKKSKSIQY